MVILASVLGRFVGEPQLADELNGPPREDTRESITGS